MLNNESRVKNSARNALFSSICQIVILLCTFITRTVFIKFLGSSYLGVSGLFTNILTILSIADLGFDTAIIYSMYKPIAENDLRKLSALMRYFKKIYFIIGTLVFIVGILLIPFLKYFVNLSNNIGNVTVYYLLYLLDTVFTYFLANRTSIINADQKMYIIKRYTLFFKIIQSILQIITLLMLKNFIIYLIIQILGTFVINLYGAIKAKKMYPFLNKSNEELNKSEKKEIFNNVKSMFIYKIGGVILNNTDNIIISILITTEMVGLYSNYTMIISAVQSIVALVFSSMIASIGNLNAKESKEKSEDIFYKIDLLSTIIYGFCTICVFVLCNSFINLMWGSEYVLSNFVLIAALINFEIVGLLHPLRLYRETTGVFREIKYIFLWTSSLNIIFSLFLGNIFNTSEMKLFGIIIATAIARILTTLWFEPKKIFNCIFNKSVMNYFVIKIKDIIILIFNCIITYYICNLVVAINWIMFVVKIVICIFINLSIYILFYHNRKEFIYFKEKLKSISKKIIFHI